MVLKVASWASSNGIKTDTTYIHEDEECGRSLRASKFIGRGEKILFCPPQQMINNQFIIEHTKMKKYLMQYPQEIDPMQLMMAFLLIEYQKGPNSEFEAFIDSLPRKFSLPVLWSESLVAMLPPELNEKKSDMRSYLQQCIERVQKLLNEFDITDVSCDDIKWAFCCVNTRCFYVAEHMNPLLDCSKVKNNMVLIPYLDMCNHSATTLTDYDVNVDGCDIIATNDIEKDSEIYLCYGAHSNYMLLMEYGFMVPDNPNDCVIFAECDLLSSLSDYSEVLKSSKRFAEFCSKELFFMAHGQPSWALVTMLAALKTNDFEYFFQEFFSGYLGFKRHLNLVKRLCRNKAEVYRNLLKTLSERGSTSDSLSDVSLLKRFLQSRIDLLEVVRSDLD